jgi:hypothetical protein
MSAMNMITFLEATPEQLSALIAALDHEDFKVYYLDKYLRWVEAGTRLPIDNNIDYWEKKNRP